MIPADGNRASRVLCWSFGVPWLVGAGIMAAMPNAPKAGIVLTGAMAVGGLVFVLAGCFVERIFVWLDADQ